MEVGLHPPLSSNLHRFSTRSFPVAVSLSIRRSGTRDDIYKCLGVLSALPAVGEALTFPGTFTAVCVHWILEARQRLS